MALKAKFQVKNKIENRVVLVPVVGFETIVRDLQTKRKLTEKQALKKSPTEKFTERKLTENLEVWDTAPSARIELVIDKPSAASQFKEGDVFELSFKKVK